MASWSDSRPSAAPSPFTGSRSRGGWHKPFASTATKQPTGTRNTTRPSEEGCSLHGAPGRLMVGPVTRPTQPSRSSSTGLSFSTGRWAAGARRLVGFDPRPLAGFVERARAYCQ